jgi:predicted MFS family arabinose efflux permease
MKMLSGSAIGYGLAACLFTGTTSVPAAYLGAFAWGVSGAVFFAVAVTALQQLAPVHVQGRIMGVTATIESAADTISLPLAGVISAIAGIRPGAAALAAVAIAAGSIGFVLTVRSAGGAPGS